jgi:hypothetical protein
MECLINFVKIFLNKNFFQEINEYYKKKQRKKLKISYFFEIFFLQWKNGEMLLGAISPLNIFK